MLDVHDTIPFSFNLHKWFLVMDMAEGVREREKEREREREGGRERDVERQRERDDGEMNTAQRLSRVLLHSIELQHNMIANGSVH